ncbi:hypothetical protein KAH55_13250 [bacterium]|nr:hypothetical protein [bacterium]
MKKLFVLILLISSAAAFGGERNLNNNTVQISETGVISSDSVGVTCKLTASATTTTTTAGTWYPIQGTFSYPMVSHFTTTNDTIVICCPIGRVSAIIGVTFKSSVNATTVSVGVSRNGSDPTNEISKALYLKTGGEYGSLTVVGFGYLSVDDKLVFVISSDKSGAVITISSFNYGIERFGR